MAGVYTEIKVKDGKVFGTDHGCGCCSSEDELTRQDVLDHIQLLKEDIQQAEDILAKML